MFLHYCTTLVGVCLDSSIVNIFLTVEGKYKTVQDAGYDKRVFGVFGNGEHGLWLLGEEMRMLKLAYLRIHFDVGEGKKEGGKRRRKGKGPERRLSLNEDVKLNSAFGQTLQGEKEKEKDDNADEDEDEDEEVEYESRKYGITAVAMHEALVVFGDSKGHMWFNQTPALRKWTPKTPVHSDRISVLRLTERIIISASYDKTVKLAAAIPLRVVEHVQYGV
ncbi:hypothetical protein HF521_003302 [Silurus meridionalis]|uniref:Uncharacterized protein n=1 Tax=Silurus meridionalis TaxID=175797 RepID=A0A8T0B2F4_SILME|nr:hypothetical protein HF521_003302 [Silurus meridionalis]